MTTTRRQTKPSTNPDASITEIRPMTSRSKLAQLETMGITTARDLLWHLPRHYEDRSEITPLADAVEGMRQTFQGTVSNVSNRQTGRTSIQRATLFQRPDRTGERIQLMWFGQQHLARRIEAGNEVLVSGTVDWSDGPMLKQPDVDVIHDSDGKHRPIHNGMIAPTYKLTAGMAQAFMRRTIPEVLEQCRDQLARGRPRASGPTLYELLLGIHRPRDIAEADTCLDTLARDELLAMQIALLQNRRLREAATEQKGLQIETGVGNGFLQRLPFEPTSAQLRCIEEVRQDLTTDGPTMNRLVQGEVGSGKTVVAVTAAIDIATAGGQTALLAPTELLAEQHFASVSDLMATESPSMRGGFATHVIIDGLARPFCIALLTGSTRAKDRRQIQALLKSGSIDLLVGTHAIIQAGVEVPGLQLAIADEQHRFGVAQRTALRQRAHYMMLTATAIPRTMQLALYRDLDVSTINEMPKNRIPIRTEVLAERQRDIAVEKIREEVAAGRQAFIVFPLIEESEGMDAKSVTEEFEYLRNHTFHDLTVGLIHGRMKPRDRERELRAFKEGTIQVMTTTAVIEVGIDIPNATVMLIESAERFGIAQLHQFRGRVGRGEHASTCYIMITPGHQPSPDTRRRLIAVRDTNDGMKLAQVDLAIRGHGDIAGARQSGTDDLLKAAAGYTMEMLQTEREIAEQIHASDPDLRQQENRALASAVRAMQRRMQAKETDH